MLGHFADGSLVLERFSVGETIVPMLIGLAFIGGIGYTIKTGLFRWKGGGCIYRSQEPVAFWFWVSVFTLVGLFGVLMGLVGLLRYWELIPKAD